MEPNAELLLQSALSLPAHERAEIAASLIESLDEETDADVEAAWGEEIKRRLEQIDKGEVQLIPADEVMRELRERLNG